MYFRTGSTQTEQRSHRRWLETGNFGFKKMRSCTIRVANTKAQISFTVTVKLMCTFGFTLADYWISRGAAHFTSRQQKHHAILPRMQSNFYRNLLWGYFYFWQMLSEVSTMRMALVTISMMCNWLIFLTKEHAIIPRMQSNFHRNLLWSYFYFWQPLCEVFHNQSCFSGHFYDVIIDDY